MKRRDFLKTAALTGSLFAGANLAVLNIPEEAEAYGTGGGIDILEALDMLEEGKAKNIMPEIRPEIRSNPRAVFLIETHVDALRDEHGFFTDARPQLEEEGKKAAQQIFVKGSVKGGSAIILPNFVVISPEHLSPVTGIVTSPDFIAGFVEGLREIGTANIIISSRSGSARNRRMAGIYSVFDVHGIDFMESKYRRFSDYSEKELTWHRVSAPVVWKNIPTYRPIGDRDCFFINMPTLKCHNLGLTTLSTKNLQGAVPTGYGHYCNNWAAIRHLCEKSYAVDFRRDFLPDYQERVEAAFLKHRAAGFKYWDIEGTYPQYEAKGGWEAFRKIKDDYGKVQEFMHDIKSSLMWDEMWCQRALDSAAAIEPSINIIEGIIGRDGSGFAVGRDELCNVIVIGLSKIEVDSVGSYLMGHNPSELFYTRLGKERGLGECDINRINLYRIRNGEIVPVRNLSEIKRYKLGVNIHTHEETGKRLFW